MKMATETKRQICLGSIQSSLFHASGDDNRSNWTSTRFHVHSAIEEINRWYDTSIPGSIEYYNIAAAVKFGVVLRVNAHRCRSTPEMKMFVTHGDLPGTYIILVEDHGYYTIRGLLEPVPEITIFAESTDEFALNNYLQNNLSATMGLYTNSQPLDEAKF